MVPRLPALPRGIASVTVATVALALALTLVLACGPAAATTLSWKAAVSGSAATSTNWTPTKVPAAGDALVYNLVGTYNVTYGASVPSILSQTHNKGTVRLDVTPTLGLAQNFKVGDGGTDNAAATLLAGTMNVTGDAMLGVSSGSIGTLAVTTDATLNGPAATSQVIVGFAGTGTLDVLSGGTAEANGGILVGANISGHGTVLVSGFSTSPSRSSSLFANGSSDIDIAEAGSGNVTVTGGATIGSFHSILVAPNDLTSGTLTVTGTGNAHSTSLSASVNLDIARNDIAGPGGTATVEISDSAHAQVLGPTRVGDPQGGTGTLRMRKGGVLTTHGLIFDTAHGVLDFNGGTIDVTADPFVPPTPSLDLDSADPELLSLEFSTTAAVSNASPTGYSLIVGDAHSASLALSSSAHLTTTSQVAVGVAPGASGTVSVQKSAQLSGAGHSDLSVGLGGTGTLNMFSGSKVTQSTVNVAYAGGSMGTVHVTGAGTILAADSVFVGGHSGAAGGTGKLLVDTNGLVSTAGNATSLVDYPGDSVIVNSGGSIDASGAFKLDGALALAGGIVIADSIALGPTARVSGNGTVNGAWFALSSSITTASGGPLTLGSPTSPHGFFDLGVLDAGAQTVTVLDAATATFDSVSLATGTLTLPAAGGAIAPNGRLSGIGNVNGKLSDGGTIVAGAAPGLVFSGIVSTLGQTISGGTLNFASGGGYFGFGSLNVTQLIVAPGATITTNGATTLGSTAAGSTVSLGGVLHVGPGTTTVNNVSASPLALGTSTQVTPAGTLARTNGFTLLAGDSLLGAGTMAAPFTSSGIISPGFGGAGQFTFTTTFAQGAGGKMAMEIGTNSASAFDKVTVTGAATLAGTLDVRLLPGTVPQPGQDFTLMTYGSHTGTFGTVTINGQPVGSQFTLTYNATSLVLHVNAITVDAPSDPAAGILAVALAGRSGARGETYFDLALPRAAHVDLAAFTATGRRVAALFRGDLPAGRSRYALRADGRALAPGLYFGRAVVTEAAAKTGAAADGRVTVRTARAVVER